VNNLSEVSERLANARGLPETLAAAHAALDVMLPVIYQRQDQADGAYAAFALAGTSVASSRLALWSAPSLPRLAASPVDADDLSGRHAAAADDATSALAGLARLLASRLDDAAASAAEAGDWAACAEAARHARAACSSLGGPPP